MDEFLITASTLARNLRGKDAFSDGTDEVINDAMTIPSNILDAQLLQKLNFSFEVLTQVTSTNSEHVSQYTKELLNLLPNNSASARLREVFSHSMLVLRIEEYIGYSFSHLMRNSRMNRASFITSTDELDKPHHGADGDGTDSSAAARQHGDQTTTHADLQSYRAEAEELKEEIEQLQQRLRASEWELKKTVWFNNHQIQLQSTAARFIYNAKRLINARHANLSSRIKSSRVEYRNKADELNHDMTAAVKQRLTQIDEDIQTIKSVQAAALRTSMSIVMDDENQLSSLEYGRNKGGKPPLPSSASTAGSTYHDAAPMPLLHIPGLSTDFSLEYSNNNTPAHFMQKYKAGAANLASNTAAALLEANSLSPSSTTADSAAHLLDSQPLSHRSSVRFSFAHLDETAAGETKGDASSLQGSDSLGIEVAADDVTVNSTNSHPRAIDAMNNRNPHDASDATLFALLSSNTLLADAERSERKNDKKNKKRTVSDSGDSDYISDDEEDDDMHRLFRKSNRRMERIINSFPTVADILGANTCLKIEIPNAESPMVSPSTPGTADGRTSRKSMGSPMKGALKQPSSPRKTATVKIAGTSALIPLKPPDGSDCSASLSPQRSPPAPPAELSTSAKKDKRRATLLYPSLQAADYYANFLDVLSDNCTKTLQSFHHDLRDKLKQAVAASTDSVQRSHGPLHFIRGRVPYEDRVLSVFERVDELELELDSFSRHQQNLRECIINDHSKRLQHCAALILQRRMDYLSLLKERLSKIHRENQNKAKQLRKETLKDNSMKFK